MSVQRRVVDSAQRPLQEALRTVVVSGTLKRLVFVGAIQIIKIQAALVRVLLLLLLLV